MTTPLRSGPIFRTINPATAASAPMPGIGTRTLAATNRLDPVDQSCGHPPRSVLQADEVEIHQQADTDLVHTKVDQELSFMFRKNIATGDVGAFQSPDQSAPR